MTHLSSNTTSLIQEYPVDSFVLVHYRSGKPPTRLHTVWKGPMRVLSGTDSRYLLLDLVSKKEHRYHASDMKPFIFDRAISDPLDVARHDYLEFFIEKILGHRGNFRQKSSLEFHIKWLGYSNDHNTWEPYKSLSDLDLLHEYLISKKLDSLIPSKFLHSKVTADID